jgi:hypothetical protein
MKHLVKTAALILGLALLAPAVARADEKFLGNVTKIEMAGGQAATSAVATLKSDEGKTVDLFVDDKITLDKFKDRRISPGDQIKAKYTVEGGKNHATYFKKPGGC